MNFKLRLFFSQKVQNCLEILNFDAKMLILTPEILTDTLVLAAASASFFNFLACFKPLPRLFEIW